MSCSFFPAIFALHRAALARGPEHVVPLKTTPTGRPRPPRFLVKGQRSPQQIKNMNTQNNNNTAAPSVTIAPRNPVKGILNFVVTLTTAKEVRSYPCRTRETALKLAEPF